MDWSKKSNIAIFFGSVAVLISAIVLVVVYWDKLLSLLPCKCKKDDAFADPDLAEELQDFADLNKDT